MIEVDSWLLTKANLIIIVITDTLTTKNTVQTKQLTLSVNRISHFRNRPVNMFLESTLNEKK